MSEQYAVSQIKEEEKKKEIPLSTAPTYFHTGRAEFDRGREIGRGVFYSDEMRDIASKYQDAARGYEGQTYAPLKKEAMQQADGTREAYLRQMASRQARAGIGGARAKAAQTSMSQGMAAAQADTERRFTMDNADLQRKGQEDYTNFIMNQKFGELGTGLGYAQLGTGERAAQAQMAIANKEPESTFAQRIFRGWL